MEGYAAEGGGLKAEEDYRVVIAKNAEGNWVLSAFDMKNSKKSKLNKKNAAATGPPSQPEHSEEAGAVTSNSSAGKDTNNSGSGQGNTRIFSKAQGSIAASKGAEHCQWTNPVSCSKRQTAWLCASAGDIVYRIIILFFQIQN